MDWNVLATDATTWKMKEIQSSSGLVSIVFYLKYLSWWSATCERVNTSGITDEEEPKGGRWWILYYT